MPWPPELEVSITTPMKCNAEPRCPYCIDAQCKIGEGEWADTDTVADAVQVKFKLLLVTKK